MLCFCLVFAEHPLSCSWFSSSQHISRWTADECAEVKKTFRSLLTFFWFVVPWHSFMQKSQTYGIFVIMFILFMSFYIFFYIIWGECKKYFYPVNIICNRISHISLMPYCFSRHGYTSQVRLCKCGSFWLWHIYIYIYMNVIWSWKRLIWKWNTIFLFLTHNSGKVTVEPK